MATARSLTLVDLLHRHRHTTGLSQDELAKRAGLSRTGLNELERGLKRAPTASLLEYQAGARATRLWLRSTSC